MSRALTPLEMATKLSWNPSRMVGLLNKGHFSPGADADVTVLDPAENKPTMSLVAGKRIMVDGQVVGSGVRIRRVGIRAYDVSGMSPAHAGRLHPSVRREIGRTE